MFAQLFGGQVHARIAAIVILAEVRRRHRLAVDDELVVLHLDPVPRQSDQALDVVDARVGRIAEHHHVAALRLPDAHHLLVEHRQAQAIGELVDDDEIPIDQGRHHRVRGNPERFEHERAQHQHGQRHGKEAAGIVDGPWFGNIRQVLAGRLGRAGAQAAEDEHVDEPDDPGHDRDHQQHGTEIQLLRAQQPDHAADDQHRQRVVDGHDERRVMGDLRGHRQLPPWPQEPVVHHADQRCRDGDPGQQIDNLHQHLVIPYSVAYSLRPICSTARNASCGISTEPTCFMRFLPAFCFSRSLRLRLRSPP